MKRIAALLFTLIISLSACASPAASTSAPIEQAEATSTSQPAEEVVPMGNMVTATFTPEPTLTPTSIPPSPRWYWAFAPDTSKILVVNQFGEQREIGSLPASEQANSRAFPVDFERALLLTDNDVELRAYLLTLDGMQPINLPSELIYDSETSAYSLSVPAVYGDQAIFAYTNQQSSGGGGSSMADSGPLVFVDLQSLTSKVIDTKVNHNIFSAASESRLWAYASQDGRYIRYLDGDTNKMSVRELDMSSGGAHTINTTTKHATSNITASVQGDLWRFVRDGAIFDLNQNQTTFKDPSMAFRPMRDGKGMVLPIECDDNCDVKVVAPFSGEPDLAYNLPWATSYTFHNPLLYLPAPDQNLIFIGAPTVWLSTPPAIFSEYPTMTDSDGPVFRLTPDGGSHLVGVYISEFGADSTPASTDGRYMLLGSVDHQSFYIYDVMEDRQIAEMPALSDLDYFWGDAAFYDDGAIVHFLASTAENTYRDFFLVYSILSGGSYYWENENSLLSGCMDILEDDTLVCGTYVTDTATQELVRYDPKTNTSITLLDNIFYLQLVR